MADHIADRPRARIIESRNRGNVLSSHHLRQLVPHAAVEQAAGAFLGDAQHHLGTPSITLASASARCRAVANIIVSQP